MESIRDNGAKEARHTLARCPHGIGTRERIVWLQGVSDALTAEARRLESIAEAVHGPTNEAPEGQGGEPVEGDVLSGDGSGEALSPVESDAT